MSFFSGIEGFLLYSRPLYWSILPDKDNHLYQNHYTTWMKNARALFSSPKILQNFSDSPSHRIFRRMLRVLNIDEKIKTNCTVWSKLMRRIF